MYLHGLREARFILGVWVCCLVWTVGYSYLFGYRSHEPDPNSAGPSVADMVGPLESFNREPDSLTYPLGLGIPDWIFYGIAVPWCICIGLTFFYALVLFADDDLGVDVGVSHEAERTE